MTDVIEMAPDDKAVETDGTPLGSPAQYRILVVDDEESILSSLTRLLRREGYVLLTAKSGQAALELLAESPVHLVISDQRMPGMTGTELLHEVRRRWPETLRIILSGYSDVDSIIQAINEGAIYKYLTKPWNDQELRLHIRRALERFSLGEENRRLTAEIREQNQRLRALNERLDQHATDVRTGLNLSQMLLDTLDSAVIAVDTSGLIVNLNKAAQALLASPDAGLTGGAGQSALPLELRDLLDSGQHSGLLELSGKRLRWRMVSLINAGSEIGRALRLWEDPDAN